MNLKDYIDACKRTSSGTLTKEERLTSFALGIVGEAAELNELINGNHTGSGKFTNVEPVLMTKDVLCKEVGDVLWYTAMLIHDCVTVERYRENYDKLTRWGRGEIIFVPFTDYYNKETKSIDLGLIASRISTIAGNVADAIKKHVFHKHPLDNVWVIGRCGDIYWLCEFLLRCCSLTMNEAMEKNIQKLKDRYPDGFSIELSINRSKDE